MAITNIVLLHWSNRTLGTTWKKHTESTYSRRFRTHWKDYV